jgi:hypothetical protein
VLRLHILHIPALPVKRTQVALQFVEGNRLPCEEPAQALALFVQFRQTTIDPGDLCIFLSSVTSQTNEKRRAF